MMRTYLGLIPRNLIKNGKRTIALAVSIVLAVTLITSVEILVSGVVNNGVTSSEEHLGKFYAYYMNIFSKNLNRLKQDDRINKSGIKSILGYSKLGNNTISLNGIDEEAIDLIDLKLLEGSYPKKLNEVVVEDSIYKKLFNDKKIGDKIKLTFEVQRLDTRQGIISKNNENFELVLCGVVHNPLGSNAMEAGRIYIGQRDAENIVKPEDMIYDFYFTTKDNLPVRDTIQYFNDRYKDLKIGLGERDITQQYKINTARIDMIEMYNKSKKVVVIIDIIIALAAAILIYNIFNISIAERVRHFGLLRSIGITPSQIKIIVFGEAILLGIVFIPIGILVGIKASTLLMSLVGGVGNRMIAVDSSSYNITTITIAAFISIITASYKPAKTASSISPLEAMKNSIEVLKNEEKKESIIEKLINNIFGYTGKMAYMNLSRNKKRFIATVVSISMGVTIYIGINYFIDSIDPVKSAKSDKESDFVLFNEAHEENIGFSNGEINEIKSIPGVKNVKERNLLYAFTELKEDKMNEEGIKEVEFQDNPTIRKVENTGMYRLRVHIIGCSKGEMDAIRKKIKNEDINNDKNIPELFLVQNKSYKKITNIIKGDKIDIEWGVRKNNDYDDLKGSFVIGEIIDEIPIKLSRSEGELVAIAAEEDIEKMFSLNGYKRVSIDVDKGADVKQIEDKLKSIAACYRKGKLSSLREDLENTRRLKHQMIITLYALFVVIAMFVLINIINTISMNIITRKQEFGMLRAIGMTKHQLTQMIIKEGLIYGITGSIFGSLFGIFISYLIFKGVSNIDLNEAKWTIEYGVIATAFIATAIITAISTVIPLRRATSMNVIEAVRSVE